MKDLYVGQKVVCVNTQNLSHPEGFKPKLEEGKKYIIRKLWISPDPENRLGVYLEEIIGEYNAFFKIERGFKAERFRPIDNLDLEIEKMRVEIILGHIDQFLLQEDNPYLEKV